LPSEVHSGLPSGLLSEVHSGLPSEVHSASSKGTATEKRLESLQQTFSFPPSDYIREPSSGEVATICAPIRFAARVVVAGRGRPWPGSRKSRVLARRSAAQLLLERMTLPWSFL